MRDGAAGTLNDRSQSRTNALCLRGFMSGSNFWPTLLPITIAVALNFSNIRIADTESQYQTARLATKIQCFFSFPNWSWG